MQRLYGPGTDWALPWMPRVLPRIVEVCEQHAPRTVFTRFMPARRPGEGQGEWKHYYLRWASMTIERIGGDMVRLLPELEQFSPPAETADKPVYSPWFGDLHKRLRARRCDTIIVSGGETDMCVLATILGAVDHGYRSILLHDAVCSASDKSHDAMLDLFSTRFGQQVEVSAVDDVLAHWHVR